MNPKLIITIVVVIAAVYIGTRFMAEPEPPQDTAHQHHQTQEQASAPAIGGTFTLIDQNGQPYTDKNLEGHYSLVFFGFTHCPDMCPMAMSNITHALDSMLPEVADMVTPVLITVDPARDTPEVLKAYIANFHPRTVALTGSEAETAAAASAFKVYHQVADPTVEDYMVNHSGYIYLMGRDGRYIKHFSHTTPPEEMAVELEQIVH